MVEFRERFIDGKGASQGDGTLILKSFLRKYRVQVFFFMSREGRMGETVFVKSQASSRISDD